MELFFGGAGIIVTKKIDNELCVLIGKRSDGQGWAIPAGKRKVSDGILKFTAIRELNEEFGFKIPQTPDFLMRVRFVFRNFAPYVSHGKELMAVSEVFRFDLEEYENLEDFLNFDSHGNLEIDGEMLEFDFYPLSKILNFDKIFIPSLVTLNKVFENELNIIYKKEWRFI